MVENPLIVLVLHFIINTLFKTQKNPFHLHDIKIQKEIGEKSSEKSTEKIKKEEEDNMSEKEHNLEELNKFMGAISNKYNILSDD